MKEFMKENEKAEFISEAMVSIIYNTQYSAYSIHIIVNIMCILLTYILYNTYYIVFILINHHVYY